MEFNETMGKSREFHSVITNIWPSRGGLRFQRGPATKLLSQNLLVTLQEPIVDRVLKNQVFLFPYEIALATAAIPKIMGKCHNFSPIRSMNDQWMIHEWSMNDPWTRSWIALKKEPWQRNLINNHYESSSSINPLRNHEKNPKSYKSSP